MAAENSVITKIRRRKLCLASSDGSKPLAPVTHIALGDGGTDTAGEPVPPLDTQSALTHEVVRYPVDSVTYPTDTTARYTIAIPAEEMTGQVFDEIALVDSEGDVAAIKTMYPKRKDTGVVFQFEMDDEF